MINNSEYQLGIMLVDKCVTDMHFDLNQAMIQDFGNLTAVYILENEKGFAVITKEFCQMNNIRLLELHEAALQQQRDRYTYSMRSLTEVVKDLMPSVPLNMSEENVPFFVLRIDSNYHGASVILQPELLSDIEKIFGRDYFIIPSSIHEVLIVPDYGGIELEMDINQMIRNVNKMVSPDERLSDRVIRYSDFIRLLDPPEKKINRKIL